MNKKITMGISIALWIILAISLTTYFLFSDNGIVTDIFPEFIGITLFGLIIYTGIRKNTPLIVFYSIFGLILIASVFGYIYGSIMGVTALLDIAPELIGATAIALVLTIIFQKKVTA